MPHVHKISMRIRAIVVFVPILVALAVTAFYLGTGKELADFFVAYRLEHPYITMAVTVFTHIANPIMYAVYGYMLWKAYKKMDAEQGRIVKRKVYSYFFVQILISFILTRALKIAFGMPRPDIDGPMTPFSLDHGHNSFPSGHTTEIVGATLPLAWWAKSFIPSLAIGIYVALVSYSRIYLGMHHILDVLAGLALGSLAAWCIHRLAYRKQPMSEQNQSVNNDVVNSQTSSDQEATKPRRAFSMGRFWNVFSRKKKQSDDAKLDTPLVAQGATTLTTCDTMQSAQEESAPEEQKCTSFAIEPEQISEPLDYQKEEKAEPVDDVLCSKEPTIEASEEHVDAPITANIQPASSTPELDTDVTTTPSPEPAPFTDPWASESLDDWAKAQLNADLTQDGTPDANGNLETWSAGVHNTQYNSTPDLDAFMYTQSQPSNFGHPLPEKSEPASLRGEARPNDADAAEQLAQGQANASRRFSAFKGFKRSYGSQDAQASLMPVEPSLATKTFDALAHWPLLVLSCFLILQVMGGIVDCRALWFSDEIRHAAVYEHMVSAAFGSADWAILQLNGIPYPDKPAVYFWFLALLDTLPLVDMPMLFMLGTGLSALFMLWATYALARVTGNDRKVSLAAGFVLLTTFYFVGVTHYGRMDLLFAAVITASQVCMYQGWRQEKVSLWRIMAFVLAAVATLIKGPIGLALPIISAILFIIWQGKWRRLNSRDGAFGFGIMLCILLAWVTLIWAFGGNDYLRSIFDDQIVKRAVDTWHHKQAWWHYLATLPVAWLPWTFIVLVLPWFTWLRNPLSPILASRHGENLGAAFLWICCISGVAFLSSLSGKIVIYLLPLFPMMAILTARGLMSLSNLGSKVLYSLFAILFILLGWAFTIIAIFPYVKPFLAIWDTTGIVAQIPQEIMVYIIAFEGAGILAAICFLAGIALFAWVDRRQARGALLVTTIFMTILIQPLSVYTAQSLDSIMSPKEQAEVMTAYIEDGYVPMTYRVFPGTYTYYAGTNTVDIQDNDWKSLESAMQGKDKIVLAMRLKDWEQWPNRPAALHEVHRQWIVNRPFVLVVLDASPEPALNISIPQSDTVQPQLEGY